MIDILIRDNVVYKHEVTITDVTIVPDDAPPDQSKICAADWLQMVGEPAKDETGLPTETFEQRELAFIKLQGWALSKEGVQ